MAAAIRSRSMRGAALSGPAGLLWSSEGIVMVGRRADMNPTSAVGGMLLVLVLGTLWVKANVAGLLAPIARMLPW